MSNNNFILVNINIMNNDELARARAVQAALELVNTALSQSGGIPALLNKMHESEIISNIADKIEAALSIREG